MFPIRVAVLVEVGQTIQLGVALGAVLVHHVDLYLTEVAGRFLHPVPRAGRGGAKREPGMLEDMGEWSGARALLPCPPADGRAPSPRLPAPPAAFRVDP